MCASNAAKSRARRDTMSISNKRRAHERAKLIGILVFFLRRVVCGEIISESLRTVNVQSRCVRQLSRAILGGAGILATVLHHDVAYVDVRYDVAVHRHVLADDESCATQSTNFRLKPFFSF